MEENKILETISVKPKKSINWYELILRIVFLLLLIGYIIDLFTREGIEGPFIINYEGINLASIIGVIFFVMALIGSVFSRKLIGWFYILVPFICGIIMVALPRTDDAYFTVHFLSITKRYKGTEGLLLTIFLLLLIILFGYLILWLTKKSEEKKFMSQPSSE